VDARLCPYCGTGNPSASRFCGSCGRPVAVQPTARDSDPWVIGRYSGLRFQVDPADPPPYRDARWVLLVLGVALAIVGGTLLIFDSVVTGAISLSGNSCAPPCDSAAFEYLFVLPGVGLLVAGVVLSGFALAKTL
jgi:hypothetical protein